ncbi:MAG: MiaB/RimO family radical SAM methylthiotransferase [Ruminococcus sp.]|jgi:threonylcarbamoyladenosine tRNA methylthiotransferase MtaB|nr:MiaB/RimO family radical SAM methylthiotransferase [Ruminococcus sp.]
MSESIFKVFFYTFGCKVNIADTNTLKSLFFADERFMPGDAAEFDIAVINSCSVTDNADSKLSKTLRQIRREHPKAVIAVCGCFPQAHPDFKIDADVIIGTRNKNSLIELILKFIEEKSAQNAVSEYDGTEIFEDSAPGNDNVHTRAFLKIQDGCECRCTYCIIPDARGKFRSKPIERVLEDVWHLIERGYREIVITGINIAFYGEDIEDEILGDKNRPPYEALITLLEQVDAIIRMSKKRVRIRLGSLEPRFGFSQDFFYRLSNIKSLCPHFHIPLQSGSDSILYKMGRKYDLYKYFYLINDFRDFFPDAAFSTDVIVGFPGETAADFLDTYYALSDIGFSRVHVFPYSKREGTPAAEMPEQVPEAIKNERARRLTSLAHDLRNEFITDFIGKKVEVLYEFCAPGEDPHGFSEHYIPVISPGADVMRNDLRKVYINDIGNHEIFGMPI